MTKTIEQKMRDRENKVKRKAEIASFPLPIRTAFETATDCIGMTDGSDHPEVLRQLRIVQNIANRLPDNTTIGQLSIAYLEHRLVLVRDRQ